MHAVPRWDQPSSNFHRRLGIHLIQDPSRIEGADGAQVFLNKSVLNYSQIFARHKQRSRAGVPKVGHLWPAHAPGPLSLTSMSKVEAIRRGERRAATRLARGAFTRRLTRVELTPEHYYLICLPTPFGRLGPIGQVLDSAQRLTDRHQSGWLARVLHYNYSIPLVARSW